MMHFYFVSQKMKLCLLRASSIKDLYRLMHPRLYWYRARPCKSGPLQLPSHCASPLGLMHIRKENLQFIFPYYKKRRRKRFYIKKRSFIKIRKFQFIGTQNKVWKGMTIMSFPILAKPTCQALHIFPTCRAWEGKW